MPSTNNNNNNTQENIFVVESGVLTGYTGTDTEITIPDSVTSIGIAAFRNCTSLTSITIPDSVTFIDGEAFAYCTSLTSITIPNSVIWIGGAAFEGCTSLTNIVIPDSVVVGPSAFVDTGYYNNTSNWDNGVLYIGSNLIEANTNLSGSYNIKQGTICIGGYAFQDCTSLTNIVIPDSVMAIDAYAFSGCLNLTINFLGTESQKDEMYISEEGNEALLQAIWKYGLLDETENEKNERIKSINGIPLEAKVAECADKLRYVKEGTVVEIEPEQIVLRNGVNNIEGSYAFTILDINETNKTYTLDGVEGLEVGDVYSANVLNTRNSSVSGDNVGKITEINGNVVTVDVFFGTDPKYPGTPFKPIDNFIEDGYDKERNIFRIIAKPLVGTRKIGDGARVNGLENQALSKGSNADGNENVSYAAWADTYGKGNKAGFCASAGGLNTHAKGKYSKTDGQGTITGSSLQYAHGKYNIEDTNSEFAEIVGNGTSASARSNAYTLDWEGNAWFAGEVKVGKHNDVLMTNNTLIQLLLTLGIELNMPQISDITRMELEDYAGNVFDNNGAKMTAGISASPNQKASNGKWLNAYTMGNYDFTKVLKAYIRTPIMILEDGYYNMSAVMNYRGTGWVSEVTINIDGTKLLVNDESYVEELPDQIFNANFSKAYKYNKNDIYLTRGIHSLEIRADRAKKSPTSQGILFAMDYIEFTKQSTTE